MASTETESGIPKVSTANTKKEILEAYGALKEKLKEKAKASLEPEKEKQARARAEVVREAEAITTDDVSQKVTSLKLEIETTLNELSRKMAAEAERYRKIQEAIEAKNRELEEIFEIERSAYSLAALVEAQKLKKAEFEAEMDQVRAEWNAEKRRHEEALQEKKVQEEKQRKREKEEYEYSFKREKDLKIQDLRDQLAALQRELQQKREDFERQVADKEEALLQRDIAVTEREKHMETLEKRVQSFPEELEKSVLKAVREATERTAEDARKNEALLLKGLEGEKNVLLTRIDGLEKTLEAQRKQIEVLTRQLENAYVKVQDIAVKAVSMDRSSLSHVSPRESRE
ncbi:MAG: hypothetical protein ACOWWM_09180 [Desulfobacterales bacterium]